MGDSWVGFAACGLRIRAALLITYCAHRTAFVTLSAPIICDLSARLAVLGHVLTKLTV